MRFNLKEIHADDVYIYIFETTTKNINRRILRSHLKFIISLQIAKNIPIQTFVVDRVQFSFLLRRLIPYTTNAFAIIVVAVCVQLV